MDNYYDSNPRLFKAMNLLKASSIIYQKYNPEEYDALLNMRRDADKILSYDGCRLDINTDFRSICIRFLPNDEYVNHLREKFTASDMKVYVCLLQIYEENFNSSGAYVSFDIFDLRERMAEAGFRLGNSRKHSVSLQDLKEHLAKFAGYGIVRKISDTDMIINPGILTCVSRDRFRDIYDELIRPWIINMGGDTDEAPSDALPDEDNDGEQETEKWQEGK